MLWFHYFVHDGIAYSFPVSLAYSDSSKEINKETISSDANKVTSSEGGDKRCVFSFTTFPVFVAASACF